MPPAMTLPGPANPELEPQALRLALLRLLGPVAQLAVASGLPYAAVEEMLKQAFVDAASAAHPGLLEHRKVSRVSAATGINRREVTRLSRAGRAARAAAVPAARSLASELFTHWRTHRPYCDASGQPMRLPRQGAAASFEALAQQVTRDVHPRSLLDELCRLGIAEWDSASDSVALRHDAYVPRGDRVRMLGFLGDNVGDHLQAAVDNVLAPDSRHFEQALFADGLSAQSVAALRPLVSEQWRALRAALVPALEALIAADAAAETTSAAAADEPPPAARVRLGLYAFHEMPPSGAVAPTPAAAAGKAAVAPKRRAKRER